MLNKVSATIHSDSEKTQNLGNNISTALEVKKLITDSFLPERGSIQAAGYDLRAAEDAVVPAGSMRVVRTGLAIKVPNGTYGRIAPRSGLAVKNMIGIGAGVIDADYRGEVKVVMFNHSINDFVVKRGERIAQLVLEVILTPSVVEIVGDLDSTERGERGFGSTGTS